MERGKVVRSLVGEIPVHGRDATGVILAKPDRETGSWRWHGTSSAPSGDAVGDRTTDDGRSRRQPEAAATVEPEAEAPTEDQA